MIQLSQKQLQLSRTVDRIFKHFNSDRTNSLNFTQFCSFLQSVPKVFDYLDKNNQKIKKSPNIHLSYNTKRQFYKLVKLQGKKHYLADYQNIQKTYQQLEKQYIKSQAKDISKDKDKQIDKVEFFYFFKYGLTNLLQNVQFP